MYLFSLFKWKPDANKLIRGKKERVIVLRSVFDEKDLGVSLQTVIPFPPFLDLWVSS